MPSACQRCHLPGSCQALQAVWQLVSDCNLHLRPLPCWPQLPLRLRLQLGSLRQSELRRGGWPVARPQVTRSSSAEG